MASDAPGFAILGAGIFAKEGACSLSLICYMIHRTPVPTASPSPRDRVLGGQQYISRPQGNLL